MYEKEVKQTEDRIQKMKNEGRDEYEIRKMVNKKIIINLKVILF